MVLDAKNKLFINLNATARMAAGIVNCETFELSDSFKKNLDIQGTSIFGGGIVEGYMTTLSDAFKKGMSIDSGASFGGGVVGAVVVEISDSFKESMVSKPLVEEEDAMLRMQERLLHIMVMQDIQKLVS